MNEFLKRLVRASTVGYIFLDRKKQVTDSGEFVTEINCPKSLLHRLYRLSDNEGSLNRQHANKSWKYSH